MKTKHIFLTISLLLAGSFAVTSVKAQEPGVVDKHTAQELTVSVGGGLSTLQYSLEEGSRKGKFGGNFGVGYSYFFNSRWGIGTGIEVAFYNSKADMNSFKDVVPNLRDQDGDPFEFRSTVTGYSETQSATLLNIPVQAHYRLPVGNQSLQFSGGFKIGIPIAGKYKGSGASFVNTGYYTDIDTETSVPAFMGFGTYTNRDVSKDASYKVSFSLALDAGMRFSLCTDKSLYAGLYFDYGLTDMVDKHDKHFIDYTVNHSGSFSNNGVLESGRGNTVSKFTDKVAPFAVGLKLRFTLGM